MRRVPPTTANDPCHKQVIAPGRGAIVAVQLEVVLFVLVMGEGLGPGIIRLLLLSLILLLVVIVVVVVVVEEVVVVVVVVK